MPFSQKYKKYQHKPHRAKQAHTNTEDPDTHLEDAQCMGRDAGNVAR